MKIGIVLQVFTVVYHYKIVTAIYGFGDIPEDPKRIRIFLDDDEKLLVPKNSKVEYVNPVIELEEEFIFDKPPIFSPYFEKAKKPFYFGPQPYVHKPPPLGIYGKPSFTLEDLRIKSEYDQPHVDQNLLDGYIGAQSYIHHNAQHDAHVLPQQAVIRGMDKHPISYGKLLKPILLLPNGWIQGVNFGGASDIKPVTEEQPDDLKYDFRTQAHFLR